jgi:hypothetical protein
MMEGKAMNSLHDANENQAPESGWLWTQGGGEGLLRVLEFAGLPVPGDGLVISPPSGGTLTVWADGRYEFAPSVHEGSPDGEEPVSTFYGYVAEDLYCEIVAGSFVLARAEDSPDLIQGFQAWSLPELLDTAADALLAADASDGAGSFGHDPGDFTSHLDAASHDSLDPALDDLTRLILDSHHA